MNGFTRSLDRKIEASKRRQAEEQRAKTPDRAPTQGLTDAASTPNCNVAARSVPLGGCVIEGAGHFGPGAKLVGHTFEHVVFDPPINVQEGDTIEMRGGTFHITKNVAECADGAPVLVGRLVEPIEVTPGRAALPVDQICTVAEAMDRLKLAMQQDPDYARTWHDNIAMAFVDGMRWTDEALGLQEPDAYAVNHTRRAANRAATHLMEQAFEVDTSRHSARVTSKLAEAPGGLNEAKVRFLDSMGNPPFKADLSDAKGVTIQRLMTSAELEAAAPHENYAARVRELLNEEHNAMLAAAMDKIRHCHGAPVMFRPGPSSLAELQDLGREMTKRAFD